MCHDRDVRKLGKPLFTGVVQTLQKFIKPLNYQVNQDDLGNPNFKHYRQYPTRIGLCGKQLTSNPILLLG